jgi:hypothetical protein
VLAVHRGNTQEENCNLPDHVLLHADGGQNAVAAAEEENPVCRLPEHDIQAGCTAVVCVMSGECMCPVLSGECMSPVLSGLCKVRPVQDHVMSLCKVTASQVMRGLSTNLTNKQTKANIRLRK